MALKLTLTFSGLLILMVPTTATQDCGPDFKKGPDLSCYRAVFENMNWQDAQKKCATWNSNLASVTSWGELKFLWDNVVNETFYYYWIGLYKNITDVRPSALREDWHWIDGTPYDTSWNIWKVNQPRLDDHYSTMYLGTTGIEPHWNGESTSASRHKFICEQGETSLVPTTTAKSPSSPSATQMSLTTMSTQSTTDTATLHGESSSSTAFTTASSGYTPEGEHDGMSSVLKLAIGLGIGLGVVFISLLGVLIYCIRPKKQQEESRYDEVHPYSPSYLTVTNQGYTENDEYTNIE